MFDIINNSNSEVEELNILKKYVEHNTKKLEIEQAIFNIILVNEQEIHD